MGLKRLLKALHKGATHKTARPAIVSLALLWAVPAGMACRKYVRSALPD